MIRPKDFLKPDNYRRLITNIRERGIGGTLGKLRAMGSQDKIYGKWFKARRVSEVELDNQRKKSFDYMPELLVIIYLDNVAMAGLSSGTVRRDAADDPPGNDAGCAIIDQVYRRTLASIEEQSYQKFKTVFNPENKKDIAVAAADDPAADYALFIRAGDILEPDALYEIVKSLQDEERPALIYTDEDAYREKGPSVYEYFGPRFKPDFSPDYLTSFNYIGGFSAVSMDLVKEIGSCYGYRFLNSCAELVLREGGTIKHIPRVLHHSLIRDEDIYKMNYSVRGEPLISVIIPNKDHIGDLRRCIDSLLTVNTYKNIEIIIAENNSSETETFRYYSELTGQSIEGPADLPASGHPASGIPAGCSIKVISFEGEFNFSAINNYAVNEASGDYLLLLNNDTDLISRGSIRSMLSQAARSEVGIVGAKLLHGDGTIQHAGVVLGLDDFAGHVFIYQDGDTDGYMHRVNTVCDYSAVTGACLMISRSLYKDVGGMDESLKVAANDIDLCLKVRETGKRVLYTPYAVWHHYESLTRGTDTDTEKRLRYEEEKRIFKERWKKYYESGDPFYNPNFFIKGAAYTIDIKGGANGDH